MVITRAPRTRDAILDFLRADTEPRPRMAIIKHMFKTYSTSVAATRQQLHMLCKAGIVEQVDQHWYRYVAGA